MRQLDGKKRKIGVIGAGVMGTGVAFAFALYEYEVVLVDISKDILQDAQKKILFHNRYVNICKKGSKHNDKILDYITFTTEISEVKDCLFIIENVSEDWETKKKVYVQLKSICSEDCYFGVNTSAIPITKVASLLKKPENVIGMHFMNPVPAKVVVEMIKGFHTSDKCIETAEELLESIGKKSICIEDAPGFVTNRAMMIFVNEAIFTFQDGIATAEQIDALFINCFGHKMGPLQTADLIGLDTILYSLNVLYDQFQDPKYRACPLLVKMVDAGLLGMKKGRGFYGYE